MNFKDATDELTRSVTLAEVAEEIGVAHNTIMRARMESDNARQAPKDWQGAVARLAHRRGRELLELALSLDSYVPA